MAAMEATRLTLNNPKQFSYRRLTFSNFPFTDLYLPFDVTFSQLDCDHGQSTGVRKELEVS